MKKILSIVLTIAMLFAVSSTATILGAVSTTSEDLLVSDTQKTISTTENFKISVGSINDAKPNDEITVPINFTNVPDLGVSATDFSISYDYTKLQYIGSSAGDIIPNPNNNFASNESLDGKIQVLFLDYTMENECIYNDGIFAYLKFKVTKSANAASSILIFDETIGDKNLNNVPPTIVAGVIDIIDSALTTPIPPTSTPINTTPTNKFIVNVGSVEGKTDDIVKVPISLENIPSTGIDGLDFLVFYDISKLEYLPSESKSIVPNLGLYTWSFGKIKLFLTTDNLDNKIKEDGEIAYISFRILNTNLEPIPIKIQSTSFSYHPDNSDYIKNIDVSINSGIINVTDTTSPDTPLVLDKIGVHYGYFSQNDYTSSIFKIGFSNIPSTSIQSVNMTIDYDPALVEFIDATRLSIEIPGAEELRSNKNITIQKVSEKSFKILYEASEAKDLIYCEGEFAHIFFNTLSPSASNVSIQIKDVAFTDKYGNSVDAELFPAPISETSIGTVTASQDSTVVVPIKLDSIPNSGISSYDMSISFDPNVIEYVDFELGSIISNPSNCLILFNQFEKNKVGVFLDMNPTLREKGDLVYITFKVKGTNSFSPIKFETIPSVTAFSYFDSQVLIKNGGVIISDEKSTHHTVSGYVYSELKNNKVTNFSFNEGFTVELEDSNLSTITDKNGYFEIKNVPTKTYTLNITKANHLTRQIENILVDKDKTLSNPIILWAGDIEIENIQDGAINLEDIMYICKAFNSTSGDDRYRQNLDLNKDSAINLEDIMIVAKHFNKTSLDY